MGFSADETPEVAWKWSYMGINATASRRMLNYYNDTGKAKRISSVYFQMGSGNDTFTQGDTVIGKGYDYQAYLTIVDSRGVTHTSNTHTIGNDVNTSYSGLLKYTFTFDTVVYVNAGATVQIYMHFIRLTSPTCVVAYKYGSDPYGGSIVDPGAVRIYTGSGGDSGWHWAIPYIYTGSGGDKGWHQATPYVYTGSGGDRGWHLSS